VKKQLMKWQFVWDHGQLIQYNYPGWRRLAFGVIRLTSFPFEGQQLRSSHYDGFLVRLRYWLPVESDR
jgi:hypothetical protein